MNLQSQTASVPNNAETCQSVPHSLRVRVGNDGKRNWHRAPIPAINLLPTPCPDPGAKTNACMKPVKNFIKNNSLSSHNNKIDGPRQKIGGLSPCPVFLKTVIYVYVQSVVPSNYYKNEILTLLEILVVAPSILFYWLLM